MWKLYKHNFTPSHFLINKCEPRSISFRGDE